MLSSSLGVRLLQGSRRWGRVLSMGRWNRAVYGYGDRSSGIEDDAPCGDALITADFATDGSAGNAVTESLAPGLIRCGYAVYRAMGCVRMTASVMIVSIPDAKRRTVQLYGYTGDQRVDGDATIIRRSSATVVSTTTRSMAVRFMETSSRLSSFDSSVEHRRIWYSVAPIMGRHRDEASPWSLCGPVGWDGVE